MVKTPCGHFFGNLCLERWRGSGGRCPNCREPLAAQDTGSDVSSSSDSSNDIPVSSSSIASPGSDEDMSDTSPPRAIFISRRRSNRRMASVPRILDALIPGTAHVSGGQQDHQERFGTKSMTRELIARRIIQGNPAISRRIDARYGYSAVTTGQIATATSGATNVLDPDKNLRTPGHPSQESRVQSQHPRTLVNNPVIGAQLNTIRRKSSAVQQIATAMHGSQSRVVIPSGTGLLESSHLLLYYVAQFRDASLDGRDSPQATRWAGLVRQEALRIANHPTLQNRDDYQNTAQAPSIAPNSPRDTSAAHQNNARDTMLASSPAGIPASTRASLPARHGRDTCQRGVPYHRRRLCEERAIRY